MKTTFNKILRAFFPHKDPNLIKSKYNLPSNLNLNIQLSKEGWFVVTSPDLPGLVTQANGRQELIEMLNDAALSYFDVPKRDADIVYQQLNFGDEVIRWEGSLQTQNA